MVLCATIAVIGFMVRFHGHDQFPPSNWTADEYAYTWHGMSLIQEGTPTSWSFFPVYSNVSTQTWKDNFYPIVQPWFDDPPLFSLMTGATSILGGARTFFDTSLAVIRTPMIILGTLNIVLIFILGWQLFGQSVALLSSSFYALNPTVVYLSRLAVSENAITFFLLVVVLLLYLFIQTKGHAYRYLVPAIVMAGLASWLKIPGLSIVIILSGLCFLFGYRREAVLSLGVGILLLLLQVVYGAWYDIHLFLAVMHTQAERLKDFNLYSSVFLLRDLPFDDPSILYGFLILLPAVALAKQWAPLLFIPVFGYLLSALVLGAQSHWYAWYILPLIPFIALCFGLVTANVLSRNDIPHSLLQLLVLFGWSCTVFSPILFSSLGTSVQVWKYSSIACILLASSSYVLHDTFEHHIIRRCAISMRTLVIVAYFLACYSTVTRAGVFVP